MIEFFPTRWTAMAFDSCGLLELRPLVHLLFPLCVHWIAEEMTVSVLVDVITNALCPGESTCSEAIYISGLQQTVVGIFKMVSIPLIGQLADEYGRKPLLLLTVSSIIIPFSLLVFNQSRDFVYAYYALRTISNIISQGSLFCVAVAYAADFVSDSKRAAAFSWITGLLSASHVLGNLLAFLLPDNCIFPVSTALLIFCPVYMHFFLVETVESAPRRDQESTFLHKVVMVLEERYKSMRNAAFIVISSPTLKGISFVSFFYELGMSGISSVLFYYLKAVFGFSKHQYSEILMIVGVGAIASQIVVLPLLNPLVGEKVILCIALLASIAYALFYGLAWASWVPYLSASFGVIYVLVKPSTYAIISKASSLNNQGKSQGFIAGIEAIASFLSPLAMSPLTSWFLSSNAPFNCKGFSIVVASICMMIALVFACMLKTENHLTGDKEEEDIETPILS
ncbi:hippocampus abundant transcript-like protein 1 isoform X3 [Mangifera indica]|uniref:hippocampus abundant transcript-like protein 1 isoform X3 n=1 Tax=Mangifera indica TaxID=29780 RepID=UPI001CFA48A0|nr:hippocampus abundant transcript-like protein 1 isoform X3 [Mangifera indica]